MKLKKIISFLFATILIFSMSASALAVDINVPDDVMSPQTDNSKIEPREILRIWKEVSYGRVCFKITYTYSESYNEIISYNDYCVSRIDGKELDKYKDGLPIDIDTVSCELVDSDADQLVFIVAYEDPVDGWVGGIMRMYK